MSDEIRPEDGSEEIPQEEQAVEGSESAPLPELTDVPLDESSAVPPAEPAAEAPSESPSVRRRTRGASARLRPGTRSLKRGDTASRLRRGEGGAVVVAPEKPSVTKKVVFFAIPLLILGLVAGGFFLKDTHGDNLWVSLMRKVGLKEKHPEAARAAPLKRPLDEAYDDAMAKFRKIRIETKDEAEQLEKVLDSKTVEDIHDFWTRLQGHQALMPSLIEAVARVAEETNKPEGTTLSDKDNLVVNGELREIQNFNRELNARVVRWGDIYRKKGGRVEPPPVAAAPALNARRLHPWGRFNDGVWSRLRISIRLGEDDTPYVEYRDTGLRSGARAEEAILVTERFANLETKPAGEQVQKWVPDGFKVTGQEPIAVGDRSVRCTAVELGAEKLWVAAEGRGAEWLVVKREAPDVYYLVSAIGDEQVAYKGRDLSCVYIEAAETREGELTQIRLWAKPDVYGGIVKLERRTGERIEVQTLVDSGEDWNARPPYPTAEEPEPDTPGMTPPMAGGEQPPMGEGPKPDEPARPEAPKLSAKALNPWAGVSPGSWYRLRTTATMAGMDIENFVDLGVKEVEETSAVTLTQIQGMPEQELRVDYAEAKIAGEETLTAGEREYPCAIVEMEMPGGIVTRTWTVTEGPFAGRLWLKQETELPMGSSLMEVREINEETFNFKRSSYKAVVIEGDSSGPQGEGRFKMWICPQLGAGAARTEMTLAAGRSVTEIVDLGRDWKRKPPFPPARAPKPPAEEPPPQPEAQPQPDPQPPAVQSEPARPEAARPPPKPGPARIERSERLQKLMDEAAGLIQQATPNFREVVISIDRLPADIGGLRAVLRKADTAESLLRIAQQRYRDTGGEAADPEAVSRRIQQIDRLLDILRDYKRRIRAKMG